MGSRKMVLMNLFAEKEWSPGYREQTYGESGTNGLGSEWDKWRRQHQHIHTVRCKMDSW